MLLSERKTGPAPRAPSPQPSRPDFQRTEDVLRAIGEEIELWQSGAQSERQARARIGSLVAAGKDLARGALGG